MSGQVCSSPKRASRGRPKKKPGYDLEKNIQNLLEEVTSIAEVGFDDRVTRPKDAPSISQISQEMKTSRMRVRKLLITAGYYSTEMSRKVQDLHDEGLSIEEIGEKLGIGVSTVYSMLPYMKGIYKLNDPTLNAELCRQFQKRKKACELLRKHMDEDSLWNALLAFEGYHFKTNVRYFIDCETLCFGNITISRGEVMDAFARMLLIQNSQGCVCNPDFLSCKGSSELYNIFLRLGACCKSV